MQCAVKKVENSLVMFGQRTDTAREVEQLGKKIELRRLRDVWRQVDADGSGTLDRGEVRQIFALMGKTVSEKEFGKAMRQIDSGGDDEVDFDEFKVWWTKEMAKDGVVAPSTFTFRNMCVRAVLQREAGGGTGAHHWIAEDIQNVLFRPDTDSGPKKPEASPETMVPVAMDHTTIFLEAARLYADNP